MQTHKDYSIIQNEEAVKYVRDANLHIPSEASGYMPNISTISIVIFHKDKVDTFSFSLALSCHGCQKIVTLSRPIFPYGGTGCCEAECPECGNRISVWLNGGEVAGKKVLSLVTCPLTYTNHQQLYPISVEINKINLEEPESPTAGESVQSTETANVAVFAWNPEEAILGRTSKMLLVLMANGKYQMIADIYRSGKKTSSHVTDGTWTLKVSMLTLTSMEKTQHLQIRNNALYDSGNNRVWKVVAGNLHDISLSLNTKSNLKTNLLLFGLGGFAVIAFITFLLGGSTRDTIDIEDYFLRSAAEQNLSYQQVLRKQAIDASRYEIRAAAVERLTDQQLLTQIVMEDEHFLVRGIAVERLTDQHLLAKIVMEAEDSLVRRTALERLTDQQLLAKIVMEADSIFDREVAVEKLTDCQVLEKISIEAKESFVRTAATERLQMLNK